MTDRKAFVRVVQAAPTLSPSASTPGCITTMPYLSENSTLPGEPAQCAHRMKFELATFCMRIVYSCIHSGMAAPSPAHDCDGFWAQPCNLTCLPLIVKPLVLSNFHDRAPKGTELTSRIAPPLFRVTSSL